MPSVLLLGCGQLGIGVAQLLLASGWVVYGVRRQPPVNDTSGVQWLKHDFSSPEVIEQVGQVDYILYTPSPDKRNRDSYHYLYHTVLLPMLRAAQQSHQLKLWLQVSSTSVYGVDAGQWVDESTPVAPSSETAKAIALAEQDVSDYLLSRSCILRFSGIYGGGRNYFLRKIARSEPLRLHHYSNRIHQEDCVGLIAHLFFSHQAGRSLWPIYLGTDQEPINEWAIGAWMASKMQLKQPPIDSKLGLTGKRCRSEGLKQLGYRLKYPSYQSGYGEQIQQMCAQADWFSRLTRS